MFRRHACLLLVALALSATSARADEDASVHFNRAKTLFGEGQFRRAAEEFESADRIAPHGASKYAAALAWEEAGELARAADLFDAAIATQQLDAKKAAD